MRSIGARLTFWYAVSATVTLAILFALGYQLLESWLVRGLDELNTVEFRQIQAHLGKDYRALNSKVINERIRETSEYASALFYIVIENPGKGINFYSKNLHGSGIPDIKGKRAYDTLIGGVGKVRVNEFLMPPFDVTVATPTRAVSESMEAYVKVCAALLVAMLLVSLLVGFGLSRMMLAPLRLISETANRIRFDNLSERMPASDVRDEISDLAQLLNQMFDRLEAAFDQIRRFSDEASHELKTPLSLIRLHAEKMLGDDALAPAYADAVVVQIEEVARLNQIVDELLFLSRAQARAIALDLRPRAPERLLEMFDLDAMALAEHHGLRYTATHRGDGLVAFEEKWIRQVLLNLLTNAINVSPPGGLIALESVVADGVWRVAVEDDGPGLTSPQRDRVFERFVRFNVPTEGDRGSGLGLAICKSIVELHGGRIFAETSRHGRRLRVTYEIPVQIGRSEGGRINMPAKRRAPITVSVS